MPVQLDNRVAASVAAAFTVGSTSLVLGTGQGALFSSLVGGANYTWLLCTDSLLTPSKAIYLRATAVSGDTLTVDATAGSRTLGSALAIGDLVMVSATKEVFADLLSDAVAAVPTMVGDGGSGGTKGLVPAPAAGDATKFLRGDGTFATPSGGGGGGSYYQTVEVGGAAQTQRSKLNLIAGTNVTISAADNSGADSTDVTFQASGGAGNIFPGSALPSTNTGWSGYSALLQIPVGILIQPATTWEIGMLVRSASGHCAAMVLKRTLPFNPAVIDSTAILVGGNAAFTLSAGETMSDLISVAIDFSHDYYLVAYFDSAGSLGVGQGSGSAAGGAPSGNHTGDTSVSGWPLAATYYLFSRAIRVS